MDERFALPYGPSHNMRDAIVFSNELHEFFAEARAGVPPDRAQTARLHALLRKDEWYRQLACVALNDPLQLLGEHSGSSLIEEFRATLSEFPDVTPQMITPRDPPYSEGIMQELRTMDSQLQDLIRSHPCAPH